MHEFVTYADGTLVVSSDIRKKEEYKVPNLFHYLGYTI